MKRSALAAIRNAMKPRSKTTSLVFQMIILFLLSLPLFWHQRSKLVSKLTTLNSVQLNQDIVFKYKSLLPKRTFQQRQKVFQALRLAVLDIWPNATVNAFGSFESGTGSKSSDMDISIQYDTPMNTTALLNDLKEHLAKQSFLSFPIPQKSSILPLLTFQSKSFRDIRGDISLNNGHGVRTSRLVRVLTRSDARIAPIAQVIRSYLAKHQLSESETGGLKSFFIVMMTAHLIHANPILVSAPLHQVFLAFLEYYSQDKGEVLELSSMSYSCQAPYYRNSTILLLDPFKVNLDLTHGRVKRMTEIRHVLSQLYERLMQGERLLNII